MTFGGALVACNTPIDETTAALDDLVRGVEGRVQSMQPVFPATHHGGATVNGVREPTRGSQNVRSLAARNAQMIRPRAAWLVASIIGLL